MYRAPRGTSDILPADQKYWHYVEAKAKSAAQHFGYSRLETPIFENTRLFTRGVGQGTDIVEKEMYSFQDRGGDSMTLRPEGTAPACRAYLEHGMHNLPQPVRLFYFSPAFRYERPQAGRYRQHHQFGIEALGDSDPSVDSEVIELAWRLMENLGVKSPTLMINSIGDANCRPLYLESLKNYYSPLVPNLCQDCKQRYENNPLRLLDCKKDSCLNFKQNAPRTVDQLCNDCEKHWQSVLTYLETIDVPYLINHELVRGLDYYTRTVFEIHPEKEGSQSALLAGGRYDGLIQELDGPPTPGIGFAAGMERLVLSVKRQNTEVAEEKPVKVAIVHIGETVTQTAIHIASQIRQFGVPAILAPAGRSMRSQLRYVNSLGIPYAVIIGQDELDKGSAIVRDMAKAEQMEILIGEVANHIATY